MPVSELDIVRWLIENAEQQILLPQNLIMQLRRQLMKNVAVMPSEEDCNEWILKCLIDTGPPNGDMQKWRSEINMCLADCRSTGTYVSRAKKRVNLADTLKQFE